MKIEGTEQEIMNVFGIQQRAQLEAFKLLQKELGAIPTATEQALELQRMLPQYRQPAMLPPAQNPYYQTPQYYQQPYPEPVYQQPMHAAQPVAAPVHQVPQTVIQPPMPATVIQPPVVDTHARAIDEALNALTNSIPKKNLLSLEWLKSPRNQVVVMAITAAVAAGWVGVTNPAVKGQLTALMPNATKVETKAEPKESATPTPAASPSASPTPAPVAEQTAPAPAPSPEAQAPVDTEASMTERLQKLFPSVQ